MEYKLVHVGINCASEEEAAETARLFALLFGLDVREGNKSIFAGTYFECMKAPFRGAHGHLAMTASDLGKAIGELAEKGFDIDETTLTTGPDGKPKNVYLKDTIAGFAVHVMQAKE